MRVVVDLQGCQSAGSLRGIGRYSFELFKAMARKDKSVQFTLVLNSLFPASIQHISSQLSEVITKDQIRIFEVPNEVSYVSNNRRRTIAAELVREKFIADLQPHIVHISSPIEGLGEDIVTSVKNISPQIPISSTLYDLIPLTNQKMYLCDFISRQHYTDKMLLLSRSDALLSISDYSKVEFLQTFPNYQGQIHNIRGGVGIDFNRNTAFLDEYEHFKVIHNLDRFLLYTAGFDPRKNQAGLIRAFGLLPLSIRDQFKLVVVGDGRPEIYQQLTELAVHSGLRPDQLVFSGHISDRLLIKLYSECTLFVFASMSEGLGLTVLEAMACGAPVISSNTTCLPETLGDDSLLFDPHSPPDIAAKILELLEDQERRLKLISFGITRAASFTWSETASRALAAFRSLLSNKGSAKLPSFSVDKTLSSLASRMPQGLSPREISNIVACIASNEVEADASWSTDAPVHIAWISVRSNAELVQPPHTADQPDQRLAKDIASITRWDLTGISDQQLTEIKDFLTTKHVHVMIAEMDFGLIDPSLAILLDEYANRNLATYILFRSGDELVSNDIFSMLAPTLAVVDEVFFQSEQALATAKTLCATMTGSVLPQELHETLGDNLTLPPSLVRRIRRRVARGWIEQLRPRLESLPRSVGVLDKGAVRSTGRQGHLFHGPYARFMAGRYRLNLRGRSFDLEKGAARVRVTDRHGSLQVLDVELNLSMPDLELNKIFDLVDTADSLEITVICDGDAQFEVTSYVIYSRQATL